MFILLDFVLTQRVLSCLVYFLLNNLFFMSVCLLLNLFLCECVSIFLMQTELDWVDIFCVLAKGYKLGGLPLPQLFEHNMEVSNNGAVPSD